ncbi:MAG: M20 family metallo-hydrolase [Candidatus Micrarchaeaceae archaeon]
MGELGIINKKIEGYRKEMIETMVEMISIKAVAPSSGGFGEGKRAEFLEKKLRSWGFQVGKYIYKDETGAPRPNLVAKYGEGKRTVWIVPHIDTVSEGDAALWNTDPFKATVKGGKIYGRGTVDDGQPVVSSVYALRALKELNIKTKYRFGIALVSDEEMGSKYGIQSLLKEKIFSKNDMFIVPDYGTEKGDAIEVAEKSIVWLKVTVKGRQAHASTPDNGINAFRYMIRLLNELDAKLHVKYGRSNSLFSPPTSTFEMTKHEKNLDSTNIIPGIEVAYMDCRILPEYDKNKVIKYIRGVARRPEFRKVSIKFELIQDEEAAPPTSPDSEVVELLKGAIAKQRGIKPRAVGIGGGTCAAYFRKEGMPSAVWFTCNDIAHQPNEYLVINNMVEDAKVFAALFV